LRSDAFAIFYGAINVGAAISSFAMPMIRTRYSYSTAFLFPAALMVVSFLVFAAGKRFYGVEPPKVEKTADARRQQAIVLRRLLGLFIVVTFFWIVFDQAATTWTLFARDYCELNVFGYQLESDQIQGINPILIILLLPPITFLWHWLAGKGFKLRATDKMMLGFVLTTITTGVMAAAGLLTADGHKVSILWEVGAYLLITCAEICISVVGLELAFTAAPGSMKGVVTACWLLTVFLANMLNSEVTPLYAKEWMRPEWYFGGLTLLMIVVTSAFYFVAARFNKGLEEFQASVGDIDRV
jgi:POT family proton-dependent oligopeptide transporter